MVIAEETVHGLGGSSDMSNRQTELCVYCHEEHGLLDCQDFTEASVGSRWDIARSMKLCFRCLGEDHQIQGCSENRVCGVNGCQRQHHRLLHRQNEGR